MSKVYTKTGDDGQSSIKGCRLNKKSPVFDAIGDIDELAGWIGLLNTDNYLTDIQEALFEIGAFLAGYGEFSRDSNQLEYLIDEAYNKLPTLRAFIIPTGQLQSQWFIARAVCRRAERSVEGLESCKGVKGYSKVLSYLNRLSDLLFIKGYESNPNAKLWISNKD